MSPAAAAADRGTARCNATLTLQLGEDNFSAAQPRGSSTEGPAAAPQAVALTAAWDAATSARARSGSEQWQRGKRVILGPTAHFAALASPASFGELLKIGIGVHLDYKCWKCSCSCGLNGNGAVTSTVSGSNVVFLSPQACFATNPVCSVARDLM